ncbi:winged helix-turn-helix domain-containing protein [Rhodopseudomonas palustris]|uniref:winged helix-turn-helix domain-containing protein n=1 Tax=Rhodopseudomonas palustris TaxID=1076 RepID=UPI002ACDA08B|nr:winged helix-turn-helix domain-containing protein [Rhodopseudomonas palustris]WQG98831.1 winged helix-turn-helix domain-containing protein [Rhodopseudomonas palustris]
MKHILVVDDDSRLRSMLVDYLTQHAFRASAAKDSHQLGQILAKDPADLIVVDLNLGREDGLEIVRSHSTKSDAPIIIISGDRLDEADKVVGLELGASDYITKPFGLREFVARIRAALRVKPASIVKPDRSLYLFDDWTLNARQRQLTSVSAGEVKLTAAEYNLLMAFLTAPKQVMSREQLLAASRVHNEEVFDRSIDVLILRLRRKLEPDPSNPKLIVTERGAGYVFDAEVTVEHRPRAATT